jgi:protein-tyrosine phosphatase
MKVLFVCTANVCRSPLAEGYLRNLLNQNTGSDLDVSSAGVLARTGAPAFDCSVEVARLQGFNLQEHQARQLTVDIAQSSDLILCMETWQAAKVVELETTFLSKTILLGSYHPQGHKLFQIPDPRNFDVQCTLEVFELIQKSVDALHKKLTT